jgi:archaellum component FlaF (FlaF/FlaG flagellin family)
MSLGNLSLFLTLMKYLFSAFFIMLTLYGKSQSVAGSWYGRAEIMLETETNNYLTELILKQKGNSVTGIMGYYFKNQYQSYLVKGKYDTKTRILRINSVPLIYYRSNDEKPSVNCTMDFQATLTVSRVKSNLKGYFIRGKNYQYTCPDLNLSFTLDTKENTDSILMEAAAVQRIWRPSDEELVISQEVLEQKKAIIKTKEQAMFEQRENVVDKEVETRSDSIRISIYDNGTEDGDTVSIFYNGIPIQTRLGLTSAGTNIYLKLDSAAKQHQIAMFAENLGTIPPNSALMVIHDGVERYEVFIKSTLTSNGTVTLRRKKKVK